MARGLEIGERVRIAYGPREGVTGAIVDTVTTGRMGRLHKIVVDSDKTWFCGRELWEIPRKLERV